MNNWVKLFLFTYCSHSLFSFSTYQFGFLDENFKEIVLILVFLKLIQENIRQRLLFHCILIL